MQMVIADRQKELLEFEEQETGGTWAQEAQSYLEIFFNTHPNAHLIQVDTLECRQQMCRLFVKETQAGIYAAMQADLQTQDWYTYLQVEPNSHISMWYDDKPGQQNNRLYYQLIAKRQ